MKRRNFLAGILPALFAAKQLAETAEQPPKYILAYDPCRPKQGEEAGPMPVGCFKAAHIDGYVPNTDPVENPSYDPKTGMVTYIDPDFGTIEFMHHPLLDGRLPKKYQ